jgi:hypothetical protein
LTPRANGDGFALWPNRRHSLDKILISPAAQFVTVGYALKDVHDMVEGPIGITARQGTCLGSQHEKQERSTRHVIVVAKAEPWYTVEMGLVGVD